MHAFLRLSLLTPLALPLAASALRGQEPEPVERPAVAGDAEGEMKELFSDVERTLRQIDRLLQEAAQSPATAASEAGSLGARLRQAQESGEEVRRGIDRILELASQQPSSGSGQGTGEQQGESQSGQSPLDGRGEQSTGREPTPSQPGSSQPQPSPGGQKPSEPGKPQGEQPGEAQQNPRSPLDSKSPPHQMPGGEPPHGAAGSPTRTADGGERWGDLPVHAREIFRSEGGREMPPLYREWIDAYYRRLNRDAP